MKKTVKSLVVFVIFICFGFGSSIGNFADNLKDSDEPIILVEYKDTYVQQLNDITTMSIRDLSEEEAYKTISKIKNKSIEEVKKEEKEKNKEIIKKYKSKQQEEVSTLTTGTYIYRQVYWEDTLVNSDGASCKVTSGFLVKLYVYGNGFYRQIEEVVAGTEYVIPSGNGNFSWVNGNKYVYYSSSSATITAAGVVEGQVDKSLQAGFEKAGFSISISETSVCYVRKFYTLQHTYFPM